MAGNGGPDALAVIWDKPNQGGPSGSGACQAIGTGLGNNPRYDAWDYDALLGVHLDFSISSVSLFAPTQGATTLILFAFGAPGINGASHFDSDFLLIENRTGSQFNLNLSTRPLHEGNWENWATSLIVVHTARGPEFRISASAHLTDTWNTILDQQFAKSGGIAKRVGVPRWSWTAFPVGIKYLSPSKNYLRVEQELLISPPSFLAGDYEASIAYYLRLFASNGAVTGWVQRYEYWISGGLWTEVVKAVLLPNLELGAKILNDKLANGALPVPSGIDITDLYYLPGTQTDAAAPGEVKIHQGWSEGDATIVLQLGQ